MQHKVRPCTANFTSVLTLSLLLERASDCKLQTKSLEQADSSPVNIIPHGTVREYHGTGLAISACAPRLSARCILNKLTSIFYASVLLLMINYVITLSKWLWNHELQASGSTANVDNVMTKFIFTLKLRVRLLLNCTTRNPITN